MNHDDVPYRWCSQPGIKGIRPVEISPNNIISKNLFWIKNPSVCLRYSLSNDMNCLSVFLQLFVCSELNLKVA